MTPSPSPLTARSPMSAVVVNGNGPPSAAPPPTSSSSQVTTPATANPNPSSNHSPSQLATILASSLRDVESLRHELAITKQRAEKAERIIAAWTASSPTTTRSGSPANANGHAHPPPEYTRTLLEYENRAELAERARDDAEARLRMIQESWTELERYLGVLEVRSADARRNFTNLVSSSSAAAPIMLAPIPVLHAVSPQHHREHVPHHPPPQPPRIHVPPQPQAPQRQTSRVPSSHRGTIPPQPPPPGPPHAPFSSIPLPPHPDPNPPYARERERERVRPRAGSMESGAYAPPPSKRVRSERHARREEFMDLGPHPVPPPGGPTPVDPYGHPVYGPPPPHPSRREREREVEREREREHRHRERERERMMHQQRFEAGVQFAPHSMGAPQAQVERERERGRRERERVRERGRDRERGRSLTRSPGSSRSSESLENMLLDAVDPKDREANGGEVPSSPESFRREGGAGRERERFVHSNEVPQAHPGMRGRGRSVSPGRYPWGEPMHVHGHPQSRPRSSTMAGAPQTQQPQPQPQTAFGPGGFGQPHQHQHQHLSQPPPPPPQPPQTQSPPHGHGPLQHPGQNMQYQSHVFAPVITGAPVKKTKTLGAQSSGSLGSLTLGSNGNGGVMTMGEPNGSFRGFRIWGLNEVGGGDAGSNGSLGVGPVGVGVYPPTNESGQRICRQCGQPGRYKDGKCVEKWGPGPEGPGTVCDRCRKKMKRVERRGTGDSGHFIMSTVPGMQAFPRMDEPGFRHANPEGGPPALRRTESVISPSMLPVDAAVSGHPVARYGSGKRELGGASPYVSPEMSSRTPVSEKSREEERERRSASGSGSGSLSNGHGRESVEVSPKSGSNGVPPGSAREEDKRRSPSDPDPMAAPPIDTMDIEDADAEGEAETEGVDMEIDADGDGDADADAEAELMEAVDAAEANAAAAQASVKKEDI